MPLATARLALIALLVAPLPALADGCQPGLAESPPSREGGVIHFYNGTHFASQIYWSAFETNLRPYALLQPGEDVPYETYLGHAWFLEMDTPEGSVCMGPIRLEDPQGCDVNILYDEGEGAFGLEIHGSCE